MANVLPVSHHRKLDALVVAPHPDDAELGMGGGIMRMLQDGLQVGVLDLTSGEPTPFGSIEKRNAETERASRELGLNWRFNLGLPNRSLEATLEYRQAIAEVIRLTQPKWLFAPYWDDAHPDHIAATQLVEAARFWAKLSKTNMLGEPFHPERIYHYYCVHLKHIPQPAFVLDISPFWERKWKAIKAFHSQFVEGREQHEHSMLQKLRDEASYWGKTIGTQFGEPYTSREPIGLTSFSQLK
jgi:N-acetylglucosamine malate deacetylase 1